MEQKLNNTLKTKENQANYTIKDKKKFNKTYRLEIQILSMILQYPDMIEMIKARQIITHFKNESIQNISNIILNTHSNSQLCLNDIVELCNDEEEKSIATKLALTGEKWNKNGCMFLIKQFEDIISKEKSNLIKRIADAEQKGDIELVDKLLKEKQLLAITNNISICSKL